MLHEAFRRGWPDGGEKSFVSSSTRRFAAPLSRLRELRLSHDRLGDAGIAAVLSNPSLKSLQVFEAFHCGVGLEAARAIAHNPHLRSLRILQLGGKPGDEAVAAFAHVTLPSLRRLQLVGASEAAVEKLRQAPALANCFVTSEWYSAWESLIP